MSQGTGKKIAFVDFGYDLTYVGPLEFAFGWKEMLEPDWSVDFFYLDEKFSRLRVGNNHFPFPVYKWTEVSQLEKFDFVIFNNMGSHGSTNKGSTDALVDMVLQLKHPICVYVDHRRHSVRHSFRNTSRKPQYIYAFDYVFTYNSPSYAVGGVPSVRVQPITVWHWWRRGRNDIKLVPMMERPIVVSYVARIDRSKGTAEAYDFFEKIHEEDPSITVELYGWAGSIGEVSIRKHPLNVMDIRKDGLLKYNSPKAFVRFHKANYDQRFVHQIIANSRYSWCAIRFKEDLPEEYRVNGGFEGAALSALHCDTVPILNGNSRDLDILGAPLESFGACLFVDDNNTDELAEEFLHLDHVAQYWRTVHFAKMFFDLDRFRRTIVGNLEKLRSIGHQPRCKPDEMKFNRIDPERDILAEYHAVKS